MSSSLRTKLTGAAMMAVLAAGTLTGCGGADDSRSGGPTTLTVWDPFSAFGSGEPEDQKNLEELIAEVDKVFKKSHPDVTIKHSHYGYDGYETRLGAAVSAGNAPDVFWDYGDMQWKLTEPLDGRLTGELKDQLTLVEQSNVAAGDGKKHILPIGTYQGVWMYNKTHFEKSGVEPPTTQEEWYANCKKINAAGILPTQVSFGKLHKFDRFAALYAAQRIDDINAWNKGEVPYTSAEYKQGVQTVLDGIEPKCWGKNPQAGGTPADSDNKFVSGKTAMNYATAHIDVETIEKKIGKDNLGVFLQPTLPGSDGPNMDASLLYGMTLVKTSKNKDLAWEYMAHWASADVQAMAWEKIGQIPNNKAAEASSTQPVYKQLLEWAKEENPKFHVGAWPINSVESEKYLQKAPSVFRNKLGIDQFLSEMQKVRESNKQ